jgi:uncharacterized protein (DUF488 family)
MDTNVFSIGHSTHSIDTFLKLLSLHGIQAIADVRSAPFSKFNPQFNKDELQVFLRDAGIRYVFLGKELGARSDDPGCYVGDKVQYDRLAKTELFRSGLKRIAEGANTYRIAMMCAEKEPLDCHRTILVARELENLGIKVRHILADGVVESHTDSIARLMAEFGLAANDMFGPTEELVREAYAKQADKIAYDKSLSRVQNRDQDREVVQSEAER